MESNSARTSVISARSSSAVGNLEALLAALSTGLVTQLIEYGERSTKNGEYPKSWNLTPSGLDDTSPTAQRTGADS